MVFLFPNSSRGGERGGSTRTGREWGWPGRRSDPRGGGGGEGGPPPFATYWKFFTKFPLAVVGKGPILTLRLGGGAVTTKRLVGTGGGEGRGSLADRDCEGGGEAPLGGSSRLLTHLSLTTAAADCS